VKVVYLYKAKNRGQKCPSGGSAAAQFHVRSADFFSWQHGRFCSSTFLDYGRIFLVWYALHKDFRTWSSCIFSELWIFLSECPVMRPHNSYMVRTFLKSMLGSATWVAAADGILWSVISFAAAEFLLRTINLCFYDLYCLVLRNTPFFSRISSWETKFPTFLQFAQFH